MPRRTAAYLADIVDACAAIADALRGRDLASYENDRLATMTQSADDLD